MENYVLVETADMPHPTSSGQCSVVRVVKSVLRTYESKPRADEDLELLESVLPDLKFEVREVAYIDR